MMKRFFLLFALLLTATPPSWNAIAQESANRGMQLADLLRKFNERQQAVQSLTATFTERKNLSLLAKPVLANGTFLYSKPDRIKWEYSEPEPRIFLITEDRFVAY
ncbi:MAG TPA: outer membrane lipoprotein carrier protein LolA, partial [Candidatus Polarisedimenticolia bacterium]|nr:outer membrane lipoprotein carrier protein LolA [Candidatus Polarisedimenticolia bacterium]